MVRLIATFTVLFALLAASCGSDSGSAQPAEAAAASEDTPEPTAVPDPTEAPEPTAVPEPTQVPEPTPVPPTQVPEPQAEIYDAPGALELPLPLAAGTPGELIDTEDLNLSYGEGQRILYHSTSATGEPIAVSGFFALPAGDAPAGGWPLIAWAHGTVGLADRCAPSANAEADALAQALTAIGFAVVATDFEGLGTPGIHPYIVGPSEGYGVLDSIRAVQQLDVSVSDEVMVFGHSQGGHAAMFAGQLWPEYAPEIELIGVVAGAPPSQMGDLGDSLVGGDFQGYLVMTAAGLQAGYDNLDISDILADTAVEMLDVVDQGCTAEIFEVFNPLDYSEVSSIDDPFTLPDWGAALRANDTNQLPVEVPLLIIHGGEDEQIPVETSAVLFDQLCEFEDQGPTVRKVFPGQSHAGVLTSGAALPDFLAWTTARFAGAEAPDECA